MPLLPLWALVACSMVHVILFYFLLYVISPTCFDILGHDMIYLTAIGLTPGGSSTVHIYTQTAHRTTQSTQTIRRTTQFTN
jgi:hypothetical protein